MSEKQLGLLDIVLAEIRAFTRARGESPWICWVSPALHREIVLEIPATLNGVSICRAPSLRGMSAQAIPTPTELLEANQPYRSARNAVRSVGWSYGAGTALRP